MIPAVPLPLRFGISLTLKVVAFLVEVGAILINGLADWISPELATDDPKAGRGGSR